jgi:16S rRNA (uracil1498-N3)-methyltransferase
MTHRFFVLENLDGKSEFLLPEDILHQVKNVLRFKAGERFVLFDGSGYDFISEFNGKNSSKVVEKVLNRREPERKVFLFQSLLKKDNMEWVFQKGTEVGVFEFVPILSARSVKKDFNKERAEKIIKEAAEQSGRAVLPKVLEVLDFKEALEFVQRERLVGIIADPNSKKHISEVLKESRMAIFVGPEGGWTEEEVGEAKECGFKAASLGKLNLRAETAAIIAPAFLIQ